jgi:hypothetical protein
MTERDARIIEIWRELDNGMKHRTNRYLIIGSSGSPWDQGLLRTDARFQEPDLGDAALIVTELPGRIRECTEGLTITGVPLVSSKTRIAGGVRLALRPCHRPLT